MSTQPRLEENQEAADAVGRLKEAHRRILEQTQKVIVGQDTVLDELLTAMFARGHCLLVGVPGLAKTLMVRTLSRALTLEFRRIQVTPDLMPSDITGMEMIQEDHHSIVSVFDTIVPNLELPPGIFEKPEIE